MPKREYIKKLQELSDTILVLEAKYSILINDLKSNINIFTEIRYKLNSLIDSERKQLQEDQT